MKQSSGCLVEEMEKELELCDVLCQLGLLVIESRQPELSPRGRMEGPHCPTKLRPHKCSSHNELCKKKDIIEKEILSLWKNKVPICIEVLMLPACEHGSDMAATPDMSINSLKGKYLLLEQWKIQEVHKRPSDSVVTIHSLSQAVKSYLYFSQLSAWLNESYGNLPANIAYRVCPPGDFCTSTFHRTPELHHFPLGSKDRSSCIGLYVTVSTLPRQTIPDVPCPSNHEGAKTLIEEGSHDTQLQRDKDKDDTEVNQQVSHVERAINAGDIRKRRHRSISYCADSDYSISHIPQVSSNTVNVSRNPVGIQLQTDNSSFNNETHLNDSSSDSAPHRDVHWYQKEITKSEPLNHDVDVTQFKLPYCTQNVPDAFDEVHSDTTTSSSSITDENTNIFHAHELSSFNERVLQRDKSEDNKVIFYEALESTSAGERSNSFVCGNIYCHNENKTSLFSQTQSESKDRHLKATPRNYQYSRFSPDYENGSSDGESTFAEIDNLLSQALDTHLSLDSSLSGMPDYSTVYGNSKECSNNTFQTKQSANGHLPDSSVNERCREKSGISTIPLPLKPPRFQRVLPKPDSLPLQQCNLQNLDFSSKLNSTIDANNESTNINNMITPTKSSRITKRSFPSASENLSAMALVTPHRPRAPCLLKAVMGKETAAKQQKISDGVAAPTEEEKQTFRRNLCRSAAAVFNTTTGLPLQSSPAPIKKKSRLSFDYDEDLVTVKGIKNSMSCANLDEFQNDKSDDEPKKKLYSTSAPASTNSLLGNFEESMLNGRLQPSGVVDGFTVEIGASGHFCPQHVTLPLTAFFFDLSEDNAPSPYLGHVNLESVGKRGYHVPKKGTIQVTLFNPNKTVVKMFVVMYDLHDMPSSCQTFLRQRTLYVPVKDSPSDTPDAPIYLRYLIHLRFASSKSKKIYLHSDIRIIFARDKFEFDSRIANYELRSFTEKPVNPTFSPKR